MPAKIQMVEDQMTVYLGGEIDHHNSRKMREDIDSCAQRSMPRTLVLDFGGVEFMDSSGIGLVLGRYRMMQDLGGGLRLENVPSHLRKVMRIAGIENLCITGRIAKDKKGGSKRENGK